MKTLDLYRPCGTYKGPGITFLSTNGKSLRYCPARDKMLVIKKIQGCQINPFRDDIFLPNNT